MVLTAYQQETQRLLNDIGGNFFNPADLTVWINIARGEIAAIAGCLPFLPTYSAVATTAAIPFSAITAPTGCQSIIYVSSVSVTNVNTTKTVLEGRPWPYFNSYYLSGPNSILSGPPAVWSVLQEGTTGTLYISPMTDATYVLTIESAWTPIALVDDTTIEVLPYPWTDAVPYYAAYLAYLQAQRPQDASAMMTLFQQITGLSRLGVTPKTMPNNAFSPHAGRSGMDVNAMMRPNVSKAEKAEGSV